MAATMRPEYEPRTELQKLAYLIEECGEVIAAAGKTLRWGPDGFNPELPEADRQTNAAWLLGELGDLERAIGLVRAAIGPAR